MSLASGEPEQDKWLPLLLSTGIRRMFFVFVVDTVKISKGHVNKYSHMLSPFGLVRVRVCENEYLPFTTFAYITILLMIVM